MSDSEPDAADRLEAALGRIAARAAVPPPVPANPEIAPRLDAVIARLRDALDA